MELMYNIATSNRKKCRNKVHITLMSLRGFGFPDIEKAVLDSERVTKKVLDEEEGILPYADPGTRRQEQ
jgi:hypothetical protein